MSVRGFHSVGGGVWEERCLIETVLAGEEEPRGGGAQLWGRRAFLAGWEEPPLPSRLCSPSRVGCGVLGDVTRGRAASERQDRGTEAAPQLSLTLPFVL